MSETARRLLDDAVRGAPSPLPCPFCGEQPRVTDFSGIASVTCVTLNCPASPVSSGDIAFDCALDRAIERWNRRAPPRA